MVPCGADIIKMWLNNGIAQHSFCVVLVLEIYFYGKEILGSHLFYSMLLRF